ncbi:two pore domain potassium channel family protein [Ornithinibacillus sp. BX22]|uniref:Two pore domain potassium channel family protein n=2 Tax=Ornithinibacillus TaxID=484508 RepID=A0A923L444_9BACI|nr:MULTISPECIES: potassium channel family protein [Ornithinibacillus]MBC5636119.1 two pore domain potassium channel family protein [Ornithinibacillus hominis]MBS3680959.1 two pore domain potassium channel family protein [Ornithinibacillus massiliensis]
MSILPWLLVIVVSFIIAKSIYGFVIGEKEIMGFRIKERSFSIEMFTSLVITYTIVIIGFGLIYFILSFEGIYLVEGGELRKVSPIGSLIHSMYFSGVTMLTIGYGDITPIGIGRLLALIEALIGYILPTAFVIHFVNSNQERARE